MTKKEAIKVLRTESVEIGGNAVSVCRFWEALDMAVKALEEVTDKNVGKMTNADSIRAMSDEELVNVVPCPLGFSMFRCPIERQCGPCKREWLKQPAKEDDHSICGATNLPCIRCNPGGCDNRKEGAD